MEVGRLIEQPEPAKRTHTLSHEEEYKLIEVISMPEALIGRGWGG